MSLNRKTHKTRLWIGQLMKMLWTESHRNLNLYFPRCNGSISMAMLRNMTTASKEDLLNLEG